ncbi:MAG: rhomboid family intramembrane serine protease [Saprospiraceae bacterium]|nr:rhomboid family intramembrane serine protease [Saprospiraceae bacterium]
MTDLAIVTLILIVANVLFSYQGFKNRLFFEGYKFEVDSILINKDRIRLISAGFLHGSWTHLVLNMVGLYLFGRLLEYDMGGFNLLLIYVAGLIGGNMLSLYIHRQHGDYSAVGASGAVSGLVFAVIALMPGVEIGLILLPIFIPGWIFGLLYILYTIYGIKSQSDNIGHEAHLGGALAGMIAAVIMQPEALTNNFLTIFILVVPTLIFLYLIVNKPHILLIPGWSPKFSSPPKKRKTHLRVEYKAGERKSDDQGELDRILEKINQTGMNSLTAEEKRKLDDYSK